jgi:hypothetical protein
MLREAVDRYGIQYVILDGNTPKELIPLYEGGMSLPWLQRMFSEEYDGMTYVWFRVVNPPQESSG